MRPAESRVLPDPEPADPARPWHAMTAGSVVEHLAADPRRGLTSAQAQARLSHTGPNRLPAPPGRPAWQRLLRQFHNVLIYVMLAAAVITALLVHWIDTAVLAAAVVVNAVIGFIQEDKAERAMDAIRDMLAPMCSVLRDGERHELPAELLVPGDIVLLASGDKVPADLRLVSARNLRVAEAILTGESAPVEKSVEPVAAAAVLAERRAMLYSGTLVTSGQCAGVVTATGKATELGRINAMLQQVQELSTPLLRQIDRFGRWLAGAILALAALTFVIGTGWRGHPASEMFMMVVALAASAIPEGLPAIMTITLALGVRRMARCKAIVRNLPAVETLGAVTVICSDKTGTLTRNEMTVQRVMTAEHVFEVSGVGYVPEGGFRIWGKPALPQEHRVLLELARVAVLCNDAGLHKRDAGWVMTGDPTEGALLSFALKAGIDPDTERAAVPRTDVIPFESEHRFMATLQHDHDGRGSILVKGAPERLLEMCTCQRTAAGDVPLDPDYWRRWATDAAARGLRVLAAAAAPAAAGQTELVHTDLDRGLALLGLFGIIDPPREEAIAAVAQCHAAGIRVKMITGDHADTARAIGAALGIGRSRPTLTGAEIELTGEEELRRIVADIDVYARASPEHKLRLVQALQAGGEVVAMTGDGVNDAPALKRADVGVAMGGKGTEAAKEAADMVLADDNFATIANAVREGRGVYDNIRKFILFMLPTNGGEALVVVAAILFELALPLTPAQVLWINMATSSTLGLALAFEPAEHDVMARRPRDPRAPLLSWFFVWRVAMVSVLMMAGALGLFLWELGRGTDIDRARTMAVSAVVVAEMFYLFNSRHILRPAATREGLFGNRHVLIAVGACAMLQLAFVYAPPLQATFSSSALDADEWLKVLASGLLLFFLAELEKYAIRRSGFAPA
jgi:magnesium-transporting ATPase (P-type)